MIEILTTVSGGDYFVHLVCDRGLLSYRVGKDTSAAQYLQGIETPQGRLELENLVGSFEMLERVRGMAIIRA